jgi:uncharacterized protein
LRTVVPDGKGGSLLETIVRLSLKRGGAVLLAALFLTAPMLYFAIALLGDLRADLKELLPETAPSVQTLRKLEKRFGGWSQLSLLIESPDREANRRFSDDVVKELSGSPLIRSIRNKLGEERVFFERHKSLFVELEDLEAILERAEDAANDARRRANPLLVDLEDKGPVEFDISDIEKKYAGKTDLIERFPNDYFENKDGTQNVVLIRQEGLGFGINKNKELAELAERAVAKLNPARYHPEMQIGMGGEVRNLIDEQQALLADLITATAICFVLLGVVVIGYYRRVRSVWLLAVPVAVGTITTFGISYFLIGYLNASTAFLVPIIPGNGINFGLILLARYIEERRTSASVERSLHVAVDESMRGTITAALAASIAYGSLMATDFLGFKHFGVIGGLGMILCWITTFTVLPAIIAWSEQRWPMDAQKELKIYEPGALAEPPARFIGKHARVIAWFGTLSAIAGVVISVLFLRDPFEKDFNKLRSTVSSTSGAAYWDAKKDEIFGRYLTPQVILAEKPEDVPHIVAYLEKVIKDGGPMGPISDVTAMTKLVPDRQEEKLEVLKKIRALLNDDLLSNLDEEQRKRAEALRPPADLAPFTVQDLPETVRADFRELDGSEGLAVLAIPNIKLNLYHADEVRRVAGALREIPLPDGRKVESSGSFVISTDMLDAVTRDGPKATVYSFLGVIVLTALAFRVARNVVVVVGALLVGLAWLGACLAIFDLKINFLNFIGLPITFGISVDYAANLFSRYLLERRSLAPAQAAHRALVSTGGAVTLCSLTTIIGYASLLIAQNGALISFGRVAILGEFTTLIAALVIMPAWLTAWSRRV